MSAEKNKKKGLPTDFNDLHLIAGLDVVRAQLFTAANDQAQRSLEGVESSFPDMEGPPDYDFPPLEAYGEDASISNYNPHGSQWYAKLDRTDKGVIKGHAGNIESIMLNDPRWEGRLSYCDFSYRLIIRKPLPMPQSKGEGEWEDAETARMRIWLHREYWMSPPPPRGEIADAILVMGQRNRFHPVRDYLNSCKWDGQDRLKLLFERGFEAAGDARYLAAAGTKFMIGAVARVMRPGCKMDTVLILEGKQGLLKSTAVGVLFGEWFSDSPIPIGEKDAYANIQGVWGYEMAELDSFNKAESTAAKAFFSQRVDRYRPPYGHNAQEFPRQTIFVGTTNQDEYLKDYSGNRRYWPVKCLNIDLEWIKECRDQLWAEALHRYKQGESWWAETDELKQLFIDEQDSRLQTDTWEDYIKDYLSKTPGSTFTAAHILEFALKKDPHSQTKADLNRVAPIMQALGWKKVRKLIPSASGKKDRQRAYERPADEPMPDAPDLPEGEK